jgi:predicted nucleotidyltransferase
MNYPGDQMRIDPSGGIGGFPVLFVRKVVRRLNNRLSWDAEAVQEIGGIDAHQAGELIKALRKAGLARANRSGARRTWMTTPLAQSFGAASAAKPITRQTAERALDDLLDRVMFVNRRSYFLAKVTKVVVFGSFLRHEVDRLGDVDVAVELKPKEPDPERLRKATQRRVAELTRLGRRFGGFLEREAWWNIEAFRFLKGRSRAISLHDYGGEKELIDEVAHRVINPNSRQRTNKRRKKSTPIRPATPPSDEWF